MEASEIGDHGASVLELDVHHVSRITSPANQTRFARGRSGLEIFIPRTARAILCLPTLTEVSRPIVGPAAELLGKSSVLELARRLLGGAAQDAVSGNRPLVLGQLRQRRGRGGPATLRNDLVRRQGRQPAAGLGRSIPKSGERRQCQPRTRIRTRVLHVQRLRRHLVRLRSLESASRLHRSSVSGGPPRCRRALHRPRAVGGRRGLGLRRLRVLSLDP